MKKMALLSLTALLGFGLPAAAKPITSTVTLTDGAGKEIGTAVVREMKYGVEIALDLKDAPVGTKAIHIHENGDCTGPTFESAGAHFAGGKDKHGKVAGGPHAGDMENINIPKSGKLKTKLKNTNVSLKADAPNTLLRAQGTSLIIHAKPDDHTSQPSGDAGDRIACAVLTAPTAN